MKILFAASEAYPLIKTGGLADVIYSLPHALSAEGLDVRIILPAYRQVLEKVTNVTVKGWVDVCGADTWRSARVLESLDNELGIPLWLVDMAALFDRPGNPYQHPDGYDWPDNAERFTVFSRVVSEIVGGKPSLDWQPDIVHCHDWQTGLIPALIKQEHPHVATLFTIHNLSYGGIFSHEVYSTLGLPESWWSVEGLEFHGNFSMLKAGLYFADQVTTVSPTYAREILTAKFGNGFEGILFSIRHKLTGLLNGIDQEIWNPRTDPHLVSQYSDQWQTFKGKRDNKQALLEEVGITPTEEKLEAPLLGMVGRLVEQKGVDLILDILPTLLEETDANFVILGSGQDYFERMLTRMAIQHPDRVAFHSGYSEPLAHRIEAGSDMFLMPSRFEPCGLNQLYSLRYGTPPIVHRTGGLADTVVDSNDKTLAAGTATGFSFDESTPAQLLQAIQRALSVYRNQVQWRCLIRTAMKQDFSWKNSAIRYRDLYTTLQHIETNLPKISQSVS